jgi:uncharacterized protein (TIGR02246 family)
MLKNAKFQFLLVAGVSALIGYAATYGKLNPFQKADAEPAPEAAYTDKDREADRNAVRAAMKNFVQTFEKGDAGALASLWTDDGEYVADDGTTLHGRAALKDGYTQFFKKNSDAKLEVTIESVRFISHDSAVVEGAARIHKGAKAGEPTSSRISALYAREDRKWLLALLREWPDEGAGLRDVDWLIGSWEAQGDNVDVRTTYEWDEGRNFIQARFTIKNKDKDVILSGTQLIGKDPRTGLLHSWLFESNGAFGEAVWNWDGKHWKLDAAGVESDGDETSATNLLTPLDKDSFTWQSIDRKAGDESLPDIAPVKVTRVK